MTEKRGLKRSDLERPPPGPQEDETDASATAVISVEEVAAEAGYTTGAVYSNFAGKEELFLALYAREVEKRLEDCRVVVDAVGSPQTVGQAASERFGDFIRDDPRVAASVLRV
jgi:AcrR family transcriptional regulator